jgi:ribonuclease P/MRP protein subunit RPP1
MKFYDLQIQSNLSSGENSVEEIVRFAEKLGYSGIAICDTFENKEKLDELKEAIKKIETDIEVYPGVYIQTTDVSELRDIISKVRDSVLVVVVAGGNYNINRAACEDPRVDILAHPEMGRIDNGLDQVCLEAATHNNVAIQVNFREVLYSFRKPRSYVLNHIAKNIRLTDHYRTPVIVCSGAQSIWDMRAARELISIANVLGLDLGKAFIGATTVPQEIIVKNKKTLEGKRITEGVEVVE